MNTIQVSYDLRAPGRNYQPVYDYLKGHGTWCHLLESCWLIRTSKTEATVRDELMRIVDRNDKIAAFRVTGDWWATSFSDTTTEWLKQHMGTPVGV
ncbi:MAG: hypothetical protein JWR63_1670 [Conexibacter sp.]|nr:hypothetical protein [Conexibacter sp.]